MAANQESPEAIEFWQVFFADCGSWDNTPCQLEDY
jgi:hypothetical protein